MRLKRDSIGAALVVLSVTAAHAQRLPEARGEDLLSRHCAMCHAIGRIGASPIAKAPPFRTLGRLMPLESLQEPLGSGLLHGHPEMPKFAFPQQDVDAILRYLGSIQER